ncbi:uncharacterized protein HD556DRAFT_388679 [Suillus plorans]|uniref:Uncharacterized protein n=1 Tax=Suillus plorans TaxID=116603 RepID=A0A9P7ASB8_9AGAM|nr:uncharacterized protein HD556DRAFT_388679 [Suillus plorans]KAG1795472.1 hypothetical protein HD556DRAFT_388679 [Suillus plorans]
MKELRRLEVLDPSLILHCTVVRVYLVSADTCVYPSRVFNTAFLKKYPGSQCLRWCCVIKQPFMGELAIRGIVKLLQGRMMSYEGCGKRSSEMEEAICAMFRWYRNAHFSIAYLHQLPTPSDFIMDEWFMRARTLQKFLAPHTMRFYHRKVELTGN